MPDSREFDALVAEEFAGYRLRIGGLVEAPQEFSLEQQKQYKQQEAERKAQTARPSLPPNVPRKVAM